MKKKQIITVALIALTLLSGIALLALPDSNWAGDGVIYMPGRTDELEAPAANIAQENRKLVEQVVIDRSNVLQVLSTLHRPESYHVEAGVTYFFPESDGGTGSQSFAITSKVTAQRSKTVFAAVGNGARTEARHTLLSGQRAYRWEEGAESVYEGSAGSFTADDYGHMPTYEQLLALNDADVIEGYIDTDSVVIVAVTVNPDSGYEEQWQVSVSEGLLMGYSCKADGQTMFEYSVQEARVGEELFSDADFALPDGTVPPV